MNRILDTKPEVLKQDSPETFEIDPKVETESLAEQEQEEKTKPEQLRRSECSRQSSVRYTKCSKFIIYLSL